MLTRWCDGAEMGADTMKHHVLMRRAATGLAAMMLASLALVALARTGAPTTLQQE